MPLKNTCSQNWTFRGWNNVPNHLFASCDVMEYLFYRTWLHVHPNPEMQAPCTIRALPNEERGGNMKRRDSINGRRSLWQRTSWTRQSLSILLCLFVFTCGSVQADEGGESTVEEAGLGVASALLTLPYGVSKMLYAGMGGVVGGFTWVLSGGDTEAAEAVWDASMNGTYVITPEHLRGREAVRFFGRSSYQDDGDSE